MVLGSTSLSASVPNRIGDGSVKRNGQNVVEDNKICVNY